MLKSLLCDLVPLTVLYCCCCCCFSTMSWCLRLWPQSWVDFTSTLARCSSGLRPTRRERVTRWDPLLTRSTERHFFPPVLNTLRLMQHLRSVFFVFFFFSFLHQSCSNVFIHIICLPALRIPQGLKKKNTSQTTAIIVSVQSHDNLLSYLAKDIISSILGC